MSKTSKILIGLLLLGALVYFYFFEAGTNPNVDKNSPYYVNSIYMSDARVYENYLNDDEKHAYDILFDMLKERITIKEMSMKEAGCPEDYKTCFNNYSLAFDALAVDHPELLDLATESTSYDKGKITIKLEFSTKFSITDYYAEMRINMLLNKIKKETKDMSDEEKIKYVYNWIGDRAEYDYAFTYSSTNQSAYNAMVNRRAVCAGFAKTATIIFQSIGIESYPITGHQHMWNVIKYDGKYYYFDATVAACKPDSSKKYYMGIKQEELNDYEVSHPNWYMKIETRSMPFAKELSSREYE